MEVWLCTPATYDNLKVFGCLAYYHIKKDKGGVGAKKSIFLGDLECVEGYQLWCL